MTYRPRDGVHAGDTLSGLQSETGIGLDGNREYLEAHRTVVCGKTILESDLVVGVEWRCVTAGAALAFYPTKYFRTTSAELPAVSILTRSGWTGRGTPWHFSCNP